MKRVAVQVCHNIYLFPQTTRIAALASNPWNSAHHRVPSGLSAEKEMTQTRSLVQQEGKGDSSRAGLMPLDQPGPRGRSLEGARRGCCRECLSGTVREAVKCQEGPGPWVWKPESRPQLYLSRREMLDKFFNPPQPHFPKTEAVINLQVSGLKKDPGPGVWGEGGGQEGTMTRWWRRLPGSHRSVHSGKTRAPSSSSHSTRTVFRRSPAGPPTPHRRSPPAIVTECSFSHHL